MDMLGVIVASSLFEYVDIFINVAKNVKDVVLKSDFAFHQE